MGKICWMCDFETDLTDTDFGDHTCPKCGVTISIYGQEIKAEEKPKTTEEEWLLKREAEQKEEEVVKVTSSGSLSPFFKKGMLQEGAVGIIKGEFAPSGKFNNYTGDVDFSGVIMKVSLSKTSLYDIVKAYGDDTSNWVGKQIVYSVEDIENKKTNALFRGCNVFRAFR